MRSYAGRVRAPDYDFTAALWQHDGPAAWFFLSLPDDVADDLDERAAPVARGFGSVRVEVTIGATTWTTSVFPDTKRRTFILPVKKAVRRAEHLEPGRPVRVSLRAIDLT